MDWGKWFNNIANPQWARTHQPFDSIHNPRNPLSAEDNFLRNLFGFGRTKGGVNVTVDTALGLPVVWRAVELLSNTIGSLPLHIFKADGNTNEIVRDHAAFRLVHQKANNFMTAFTFRKLMAACVFLWGNGYAEIIRVNARPSQLIPFHPSNVVPVLKDGKVFYVLTLDDGSRRIIEQVNMLHFKGLTNNGVEGISVIQADRENLGLSIAAQEMGATFYGKGMKLDYAVELENGLEKEGLKRLRKTMDRVHAGSSGNRMAIMDAGMKIKELGVPPQDAQYIETRKFGVTDGARMFGVPPPLLYDLERATFNNIDSLIMTFVKFDLTPHLVNFEQEYNDKLLMESEKVNTFTKHQVDALLRGDVRARAEFFQKMIQNGVLSRNEVRKLENRNPYPGGDQFIVPSNMQILEADGQPGGDDGQRETPEEPESETEPIHEPNFQNNGETVS